MKKRKKPGETTLTPRQTFLMRWSRFSYENTPKKVREGLFDGLYNHISCSVAAPYCLGQAVTMISEQAREPFPVAWLSLELGKPVHPRGIAVFGYVWDEIDKIARNYPNMEWWISDAGLTMDIVIPTPPSLDFDQIAGKLLFTMHQEFPEQSRLSKDQYLHVAAQLESFKLLDLLPKASRDKLTMWNQKNGKGAIHTVSQAIGTKQPSWLHRETMKRLYRAHHKLKEQQEYSRKLKP